MAFRAALSLPPRSFGVPIKVPDAPLYVTALGAAVLGLQRLKKSLLAEAK